MLIYVYVFFTIYFSIIYAFKILNHALLGIRIVHFRLKSCIAF